MPVAKLRAGGGAPNPAEIVLVIRRHKPMHQTAGFQYNRRRWAHRLEGLAVAAPRCVEFHHDILAAVIHNLVDDGEEIMAMISFSEDRL